LNNDAPGLVVSVASIQHEAHGVPCCIGSAPQLYQSTQGFLGAAALGVAAEHGDRISLYAISAQARALVGPV
jgi:hypothetical protein